MLECQKCGSFMRGRKQRIAKATETCPYCGVELTEPTSAQAADKVDPGATSEE